MGCPPQINPQVLSQSDGVSMSSKGKKKPKTYLLVDEQDAEVISKYELGEFKSFKTILSYARPYQKPLCLGLAGMLSVSLCAVGSAQCMGLLVDRGIEAGNKGSAYLWAGMIILLELIGLSLGWKGRKVLAHYSSLVVYDIRKSLFAHLQKLPLDFYDRQPLGRIVTRITHDVEGMENFFTQNLGVLLHALFMATFMIAAMLLTDLKLGGFLVLLMLPAFLLIYGTRQKIRTINRDMSRSNSAINSCLSELLGGLELVRACGLEDWSQKKFQERVSQYRNSFLQANRFYFWSRPLISLLCGLPLVGLVLLGGRQVLEGTMAVGLFVTFARYCERLYVPIMTWAREFHFIQQAFISIERVVGFLSHKTEDQTMGLDGSLEKETLKGKLEFRDVWMRYSSMQEDWVLKGLSFTIRSGEKVGLLGTTGCGKTSTVSLLSRLYEYQKGEILLDDCSLRSYKRNFLREKIGFVTQDVILFKGSLRENLGMNLRLSNKEILSACEITGLGAIIKRKGLDLSSQILEGGLNLSVGERQVLSLTRILLKNPALLILDEATSSIDPDCEKIVHQAISKIMEGRTCLIIAHRLNTLDYCDRIFIMEKGRLVEEGTQKELLGRKGYFHRFTHA